MANSSLIDKERGKIPTVMITEKTVYPIICVKKYSALVKMFFFRLSTTVYPLIFYHLSGVSHGQQANQIKLNVSLPSNVFYFLLGTQRHSQAR